MPAIEREQENTVDRINWFTTLNAVLTDMFIIEYQIWDISAGLPGAAIFPVPGDDTQWENVTAAPGKFGVGSYYAYDNTAGTGWTPTAGEPLGTHRILWRWKVTGGSQYRQGAEDFEVLSVGAGPGATTYIVVSDLRDIGITVAMVSDAEALAAIEMWQAFLDRACRQWFVEKVKTFQLDGNDSDTLFFGVPIIDIDYIKLNADTDELNTDYYRVYSGQTGWPDDRRNPRIKLTRNDDIRDIYTAPLTGSNLRFRKGRLNQEISGRFGFVEDDGSVPKMIQRALLKLVVEKLGTPVYGDSPIGPIPPLVAKYVTEEKTDGHSLKYGGFGGFNKRRPGLSGITQDQEILDIVKLYRAPLGIASPADWSWD